MIKTIKASRNNAHGKLESEMKYHDENRAKVAINSKRQMLQNIMLHEVSTHIFGNSMLIPYDALRCLRHTVLSTIGSYLKHQTRER